MQTKRSPQSRGPNKAELDFMAWCKEQPSIVSGQWGVEVHHCCGSSKKVYVGIERVNIGHYFLLPLTPSEHWLFHNRKNEFTEKFGIQRDLWISLIKLYDKVIPTNVIEGVIGSGC